MIVEDEEFRLYIVYNKAMEFYKDKFFYFRKKYNILNDVNSIVFCSDSREEMKLYLDLYGLRMYGTRGHSFPEYIAYCLKQF